MSSNPTIHSTDAQNPQASAAEPKEIFPGEVFASTADFDTGIRQLLPRYDEMLDAIAQCIPSNAQRILDLGCGTGGLSIRVLRRCPSAQVVAVDYSPRMIEFAKGKLEAAGYGRQWTGIQGDFGDWANHQSTSVAGNSASLDHRGTHGSEFIRLQSCLTMMWVVDVALDCFSTNIACR